MHTLVRFCTFLVASLWLAASAWAEQSQQFGDYTIHYNAFNSTAIDAKAAAQFGLSRSRYTAMVNVAVLKRQADGSQKAVKAIISGSAANLMQQRQSLAFTPIEEGQAIYYIASFTFLDQQMMNLELQVQPDPNQSPATIKLSQPFYVD